jgi:hypothetical protein
MTRQLERDKRDAVQTTIGGSQKKGLSQSSEAMATVQQTDL